MKTPHTTTYRYSAETIAAANKLPLDTVNEHAHKTGMLTGEPIIVIMDALLHYAESYAIRSGQPLAEDGVLDDYWLDAIKSVRRLCDGDGSNAMRKGITTDSKDNGCIEDVFSAALHIAGFTHETANL